MVLDRQKTDPLAGISAIMSRETLLALQETVAATYIKESVVRYIVELVNATRKHREILRGASPRATLALTAMAKAIAQLKGRDFVIPEDVQTVFTITIAHRIILSPGAEARERTAEQVLSSILASVKAPSAG